METKVGEVSFEEWMGPSNETEGNFPQRSQLQTFSFQLSQRIHFNYFSWSVFFLNLIFNLNVSFCCV
jgi:hypothetical protein